MTELFVKERKRLMLEARAGTRGATSKSDLFGLETWSLKKRNVALNKTSPRISEPQVSTLSPLVDSLPNSPKQMKTLISNEICRANWEISSLIHEAGGSDQAKQSNEFKLWGNNFDELKFPLRPSESHIRREYGEDNRSA